MNEIPKQFRLNLRPVAKPDAFVVETNARFTILTSRLIRMEYSPEGIFEDHASQAFWYREQPVPEFESRDMSGILEIETEYLILRYHPEQPFGPATLTIQLKEQGVTWHFGDPNPGNLGGAVRTLDRTFGPVPVEPGLLSRSGWAVVDDSASLVFNQQSWLDQRESPVGTRDLYFFGYGFDYKGCIADFKQVAGMVPLIPRWSLGNWWSRYWPYTQEELLDLLIEFKERDAPLSVCVIDMDWHIVETGNDCTGWTGYTWNKELFPDPDQFLASMHELGLHTSLNLHPAEGIHPHEEAYAEMARRMGIDPESKEPVEFDLADPQFAQAYFEVLHHVNEDRGVDFWWMDWQQGTLSKLPGLDPLWWLNHLHSLDIARDGVRRPFVFSRWGGLGNHRYPVGFSGDTHVKWPSLAFQPYMTATSANVAFGWWSHDIGGHMYGIEDAELYVRWVQFGVFSPVLRLHSARNPFHERRPWGYDAETERLSKQALRMRHALIPYIYSFAWQEHQGGPSLVRPIYYEYPYDEQAYHCPNQYLFGSDLIAAPFISPRNPDTRLSRQVVWLPEGDWFDFFTGRHFSSGWHAIYGGLDEIPVFARAGAIIPMDANPKWSDTNNPEHLTLQVFPGADSRFELYEDDGYSQAHLDGAYAVTPYSLEWHPDSLIFRIHPATGDLNQIPAERLYNLVFHYLSPEHEIGIEGIQKEDLVKKYDPQKGTLSLFNLSLPMGQGLEVRITSTDGPLLLQRDERILQISHMLHAFKINTRPQTLITDRLEEIIENPALLGTFRASLGSAHTRALLEVMTGSGVTRIQNTGEDLILLWNNQGDPRMRYQLSVQQYRVWDPERHFYHEAGPLPDFKVFHPAEFAEYPWLLQADYYDLIQVGFEGNREVRG